jgi:hypothetical protein
MVNSVGQRRQHGFAQADIGAGHAVAPNRDPVEHALEAAMTTILIIVVLFLLLGGGGFYGYRRRW